MTAARVTGPEVIDGFRPHLATFLKACTAALGARAGELGRLHDWLRGEQLPHWKRETIRREEAYQEARRLWLQAQADVAAGSDGRGPGRAGSHEERLAMDQARRRRDEAEEKLAQVKRWVMRLDQEGGPLVQECLVHDLELRERCTRALTQLERMADRVQDYLDIPSATGAPPPLPVAPSAASAAPQDDSAGGDPCRA